MSAVLFSPAIKIKKHTTVNRRSSLKKGKKNFRRRLSKSGKSY